MKGAVMTMEIYWTKTEVDLIQLFEVNLLILLVSWNVSLLCIIFHTSLK